MPEVIVEKSDKAGIRTGATFVAYRKKNSKEEKRPLLFLKIGAEGSEFVPKKLDNLQKGPVGRFGLKALSNPELPIIVLQEMFFIYQDQNKKQYTIEVMHLAHGKQLFDLIDSHDQDDQQWAEKIGKALGLFHLEFMNYHNSKDPEKWKTVIHGDFHLGNVFFDEKTSRVYFIDNGDMHEDNPFKDFPNIHRILLLALNEYEATPDPFKNRKINFCLSFIKGYLSAYPLAKRKLLVPYMKAKLKFDEKLKEYTRKWPNEPDTKFIEKVVTSLNEIFEKACKQ